MTESECSRRTAHLAIRRACEEGSILQETDSIVCLSTPPVRRGSLRGATCLPVNAGLRAEARIRILLFNISPTPPASTNPAARLPTPTPARSVSELKLSEINRDIRPAFFAGAPLDSTGINHLAYTNLYPYPVFVRIGKPIQAKLKI